MIKLLKCIAKATENKNKSLLEKAKKDKKEYESIDEKQWLDNLDPKTFASCHFATNYEKFMDPRQSVFYQVMKGNKTSDGYISTENVKLQYDIVGTAANGPVMKLIMCELNEDGETLYDRFMAGDPEIKKDIESIGADYEHFCECMNATNGEVKEDISTEGKQVYFPVDDGEYDILSIIPSSSFMCAIKHEISNVKYSKKIETDNGGTERWMITKCPDFSIGGGHPNNISFLNNKEGGHYFLFPCVPPTLEKRKIHRPMKNFFKECLYVKRLQENFEWLNKDLGIDIPNAKIKNSIKKEFETVIAKVMIKVYELRELPEGWTDYEKCKIPEIQKIWLDEKYKDQRGLDQNDFDPLIYDFAHWILMAYCKCIKEEDRRKVEIGNYLLQDIMKILRSSITTVKGDVL